MRVTINGEILGGKGRAIDFAEDVIRKKGKKIVSKFPLDSE